MTDGEFTEFVAQCGLPKYRGGQIIEWLMRGADYSEMTNLPKNVRQYLSENCLPLPKIEKKLVSAIDGTVKYLFALSDGQCVESVVMKYEYGNTICVSSQVGCRMGCRFCASTLGGLVRSLTVGELLGQVITAQKDTGERISGIVLMGIGEPLDNYENVVRFIQTAGREDRLGIGLRHISLSTCGVVPMIDRLAEEELPITLSISLHASDDQRRSELMPINRKYPLDALLRSCAAYFEKTGRRISFEYTLIDGVNDSDSDADALVKLLRKYFPAPTPLHVNLIPVNTVEERGFIRSKRADAFAEKLNARRVNATVRRRLGSDINASCGQLRRQTLAEKAEEVKQ